MTQRSDDSNQFDPFSAMRAMRDANMDAWSKMMQQWTSSDAYSQATASVLDAYLTSSAPFRKMLEQVMTEVLSAYNMPTRADVTRLAERLTNIETRLDDLDAQLVAVGRATHAPSNPFETEHQATPIEQTEAEAQAIDPVVDELTEGQAAARNAARRRTTKSKE